MPGATKKQNTGQNKQNRIQKSTTKRYSNGHEIREALKTQNPDTLLQNLTALRNQLSVKPTEDLLSPNDERLLLSQSWLETSPAGEDALYIWDTLGPKQNSLISLLVAILSSLLDLLSYHYPFQALGHAVLKNLLSQQYVRRLNSYIGGSQNDLILHTLKLYNSMSTFAGGREKKLVLESFGWELKSLPKLMAMRRKTKGDDAVDTLQRPDIRTLYVLFLLSFITPTTTPAIKSTFLEQHRDQFLLMFKGLHQDSYSLVRKITELCWTGLWSDAKVKRTLKISLFSEITLGHISQLYDRNTPEQDHPDHVPADLIHHFLLAICTRPGVGICFKDQGWYPRVADNELAAITAGDDEADKPRGGSSGKIYNKILSNFVKTLKVNEDARQQELALRILGACPELVTGYWSSASLTLEPRLSSKWITNVAYFGSVVLLPVPTDCFMLGDKKGVVENSTLYKPAPPPLNNILSNFLPASIPTKVNFTKGLQAASGLVQHCTAVALAKCLSKYKSVLEAFAEVEGTLEEAEGEGQWVRRRQEMEREVRRRVPDFQVIVSFSQHKFRVGGTQGQGQASGEGKGDGQGQGKEEEKKTQKPNEVKTAMLSEIAHRLLWMYHRCLPALVAEARFDVGKLLVQCEVLASPVSMTPVRQLEDTEDRDGEEDVDEDEEMEGLQTEDPETEGEDVDRWVEDSEDEEEAVKPQEMVKSEQLGHLKTLHVLRLLKESDQFVWSAKSGTSGETNLSLLLKACATAEPHSPTKFAISELLRHTLSESILFQEDPSETSLWLLCLPSYRRRPGTQAPDDAPLEDEVESVVTFLDDCVQRCLKTPYKYIEELYALNRPSSLASDEDATMGESSTSVVARLDAYPSPLLMTVLEQLSIKVQKKLLSPSTVFSLATFVRKLGFRLCQKMDDKQYLLRIWEKVDSTLEEGNLFSEFGDMTAAIRRECRLLKDIVDPETMVIGMPPETSKDLQDFVGVFEELPIPVTASGREHTAAELVDWVRLVGEELQYEEVKTVWDLLEKLDPTKFNDLVYSLDPSFDVLWQAADEGEIRQHIHFDLLFLNSYRSQVLYNEETRLLYEAHLSETLDYQQMRRLTHLVSHYLSSASGTPVAARLLHTLGHVLEAASQRLRPEEYLALKELIFTQLSPMRNIFTSQQVSEEEVKAIRHLVQSILDSSSVVDLTLVSSITSYWLQGIESALPDPSYPIAPAVIWLQYLPVGAQLSLMDQVIQIGLTDHPSIVEALEAVLQALNRSSFKSEVDEGARTRLVELLNLQGIVPATDVIDKLIARGVIASLPVHLDGNGPLREKFEEVELANSVLRAEERWQQRGSRLPSDLSVRGFLTRSQWSGSTVATLNGLLYQGAFSRKAFIDWLHSEECGAVEAHAFIPVFHAFIDTSGGTAEDPPIQPEHLLRLLDAVFDVDLSRQVRLIAARCIAPAIRSSTTPPNLISFIASRLQKIPPANFSAVETTLGYQLISVKDLDTGSPLGDLVNVGVQWAIRNSSADSENSMNEILDSLVDLIPSAQGLRTSDVETLLTVAIQERLSSVPTLRLTKALVSQVYLKPVVVNRHLQSIIQHPEFFKLCAHASERSEGRDAIINLLHTLFFLHPANTCQPTHVEPLMKVYYGTLSVSDGQLLSIFQLFEEERKTSIASLIGRWSQSKTAESSTPLEAIQGLDPVLVLRTTLHFPRWRKLQKMSTEEARSHESPLYDPIFLLLLFAQTMGEDPPMSALAWVELFRSNIVGLVIRCLSARDAVIRELALSQLAALWRHLESADLHEKPHVIHILSLLRDALPPPQADEPPIRLPTYSTLLLAHASRGIFYPSNFIYPITAKFLLQRPELDTGDVPLLFSMLYSSTDDWKKERGWILRFLADGMVGWDDWRVLKRRHTWDLLASMYQASPEDQAMRAGVLEVLASLTCHPQVTMSLVLKSSLLSWIEVQLLPEQVAEAMEWVKILDNVMSVVDAKRVEAATDGEWRATLARCLTKLVQLRGTLPLAVPAILRLSLLPGDVCFGFRDLLRTATNRLKEFEGSVKVPPSTTPIRPLRGVPLPPYQAHELHSPFPPCEPISLWGSLVESLWRASMRVESKAESWELLTSRLLVWRELAGPEGSPVGEWARMQVVGSISCTTG